MKIFTYGTLTTRTVMARVTATDGKHFHPQLAVVKGILRYSEDSTGVPYPVALLDDSGYASARGVVWDGVTKADLDHLDIYEGVAEGLYERVSLLADVFNHETVMVWVYVGVEERWDHLRSSPHARVKSTIGQFDGYLPRWMHRAMDDGALKVFGTGRPMGSANSWIMMTAGPGNLYRITASLGETKIEKLYDDEGGGVEEEITSKQFVSIFDHN